MALFDFMKDKNKNIQEGFLAVLREHIDLRMTPVTDREQQQSITKILNDLGTSVEEN